MRIPWGPAGGGKPAGRETLQAHFDRAVPALADRVGLDLVAACSGWQAGGVGAESLSEVLAGHAEHFRGQCRAAGLPVFPEHVRLYGPGRKGFWCCGLYFPQGLPEDREPLPAFLERLVAATGATGWLQARVADRWQVGSPSPTRVARLWTWDGQQVQGWQLAGAEEPWEPWAGPPPYPGLAGHIGKDTPGQDFPFDERGRVALLNAICDRLRCRVGEALVLGKLGELPAPEGFEEAVHAQTLALQQWLEGQQESGEERLAELALLRPGEGTTVNLARFSLHSKRGGQEAECWAVLREVAGAWGMQGFVYALRANLAVPGARGRRRVPVALLHRWDGLVMQEAWAPVGQQGMGPWRIRPSEEGATPALDGLCGYHLSDLQRRNVAEVQAGKMPGAAVGEDLLAARCRAHPGRVVGYECAACGRKGCSRCMTMNGAGRVQCRECAAAETQAGQP